MRPDAQGVKPDDIADDSHLDVAPVQGSPQPIQMDIELDESPSHGAPAIGTRRRLEPVGARVHAAQMRRGQIDWHSNRQY